MRSRWLPMLTALAAAAGVAPGCVTGGTIFVGETGETGETGDTDEPPPGPTCADVPEFTPEMYRSGLRPDTETVLVCTDLDASACPDVADVAWWTVMERLFGPWEGTGLDAIPVCGPEAAIDDACCYEVALSEWIEGRPFLVEGQARTAPLAWRDDWATEVALAADGLSTSARASVAAAWARAGLAEHASVAAFARFTLQLLALGAPPELVHAATRAQADEIRHARACFGVAAALGSAVGPGALDVSGSPIAVDVADVLVNTIREGCIGESVAAAHALAALPYVECEAIEGVLDGIARDELEHAALAWRAVRWMLSARPDLVPVAEVAFAPPDVDAAPDVHAAALRGFGRLPDEDRVRVAREVWEEVVAPCAASLLASAGASRLEA